MKIGALKTGAPGCVIALPAGFRRDDVLALHRRDAQRVAERTDADGVHKGLAWRGRAACLHIRFDARHATATLAVDGAGEPDPDIDTDIDAADTLAGMVRRMLGLTQPVEEFERSHRAHPLLGPLIAANPGLRVPLSATPFEALTWAVTGQQISVDAALSVRRKFIQAAGLRHSGGLFCYPDARRVAAMDEAALRQAGFSQSKAQTLLAVSREVEQGRLPLDAWSTAPAADEIRERLLRLRGIGPWTVDYTLLRGFGCVDGSLHGDAAVRRKLQRLLGSAERIDAAAAERWLAGFSPWRALVAAHLWAMPEGVRQGGTAQSAQ